MTTEITRTTDTPATPAAPYGTPAVDILRGEAGWLIRADLPGVNIGDVNVDVDNGRLTIEASRRSGEPGEAAEMRIGGYRRTLLLPELVDTESIEARLADGVLELTIPRDTRGRTRRISVSSA